MYATDTPKLVRITYGLTKRCSSITHSCRPFPAASDCSRALKRKTFCYLWRSSGWANSVAIVLEAMIIVAFAVVLFNDRKKFNWGYRFLAGFIALCGLVQIVPTAIVLDRLKQDSRFAQGWTLGVSWVFSVVSVVLQLCIAVALEVGEYFAEKGGEIYLE